ncbi:response regulator [Chloroflexota bacterium]
MAEGKILVVDDERKILSLVRAYLEKEGYRVTGATDGLQAIETFQHDAPDLILLDVMLPGMDGLEVCREIRRTSEVPIIMLTARDEDTDKLIGLELGADDYVTKPFSPRELVARVRAVLRRTRSAGAQISTPARITLGELNLDEERFEATCHGHPLALTPAEFRILVALARTPGRVLSRAQLLDIALGETYEGYERTIDVHIKNLRRKLTAAGGGEGCAIVTVYGIGYKLKEPDHV